jgi:hypothetical protein
VYVPEVLKKMKCFEYRPRLLPKHLKLFRDKYFSEESSKLLKASNLRVLAKEQCEQRFRSLSLFQVSIP